MQIYSRHTKEARHMPNSPKNVRSTFQHQIISPLIFNNKIRENLEVYPKKNNFRIKNKYKVDIILWKLSIRNMIVN